MTRVYLETSFWLSATVSADRNHSKTLPVLEKVKSGTCLGLLSRHVFSEVLDVLRNKAVIDPSVRSATDPNAHRRLVERMYAEFTRKVLAIPNVKIRDTPLPTVQILEEALEALKQVWGRTTTRPVCPICRTPYNYHGYDGPGRDDALHVIIADKIGCDQLITFDQGFHLFAGIPQLSHLSIQVL